MEPGATRAFLMIVAFCGFRPEEIRRTETWMVHLDAEMPHVIRNTAKGGDVTVVPLSEEGVLAWHHRQVTDKADPISTGRARYAWPPRVFACSIAIWFTCVSARAPDAPSIALTAMS
jgi:hypothetical protein